MVLLTVAVGSGLNEGWPQRSTVAEASGSDDAERDL
jgi:hypothetical protein